MTTTTKGNTMTDTLTIATPTGPRTVVPEIVTRTTFVIDGRRYSRRDGCPIDHDRELT